MTAPIPYVPLATVDDKMVTVVGAGPTVTLADAVLPVPPLVEVTLLVVLFLMPAVVPVTDTLTWHCELTAMVPPVRLTDVAPAVAAAVPPQVFVRPGLELTTRPAGKLSLNATPVSVTVFAAGLTIVKVSVVLPLSAIDPMTKAFAIDGGATTVTDADAALPVPPSFEVTGLVVLFCWPPAIPVTLTEKLQDPLAAKVAPLKLIAPVPAAAVIVPPAQEPDRPLGVATSSPAGRVSVKPMPLSDCVALLF